MSPADQKKMWGFVRNPSLRANASTVPCSVPRRWPCGGQRWSASLTRSEMSTGLTLYYAVLRELQTLLNVWTGACRTCLQPFRPPAAHPT